MKDDVPHETKIRRVNEVQEAFRKHSLVFNQSLVGSHQLVLVDGRSRRSDKDLKGRSDFNTSVVFPLLEIPVDQQMFDTNQKRHPEIGDYVSVEITGATSQTLMGTPRFITSLVNFGIE